MILKHVPRSDAPDGGPSESFDKVIYLFLVAETPTLGVDGFQLQNAFAYETELKQKVAGEEGFSTGANGRVAIVGPQYSGSAESLRAAIEAARPTLANAQFEVIGITTTSLPAAQLESDGSAGKAKIRYVSFASDSQYSTQVLINRLKASGYDLERVDLLLEDNTAAATVTTANTSAWTKGNVQVIRFPREISPLRNAQVSSGQSGGMPPQRIPLARTCICR
jgi:hypothetical protein